MRLSNKYGGLQFFAGDPFNLTIVFDEHITKISGLSDLMWTVSGQTQTTNAMPHNVDSFTFVVTLNDGYVIESIANNLSTTNAITFTDNTFNITRGDGSGIVGAITITSKLGGVPQ